MSISLEQKRIAIEPVITYPRTAQAGKTYLMTVDVQSSAQQLVWPYEEEEYAIYCMLDAGSLFSYEAIGEAAIVLHRFGGTYGPAMFLLTASQQITEGAIRVTLVSGQGLPLAVIELPDIRISRELQSLPRTVGILHQPRRKEERRKTEPSPIYESPRADSSPAPTSTLFPEPAQPEPTPAPSQAIDRTFDVFISYSHHDADWVRAWLLPRLESAGLRVCIDFRDFEIAVPSRVNLENAMQRSARTLLVLTPHWIQSEWASFESLLIQTQDPVGTRRRLLPIMREQCALPVRLSIFKYADFTDPANWEAELPRIISSIRSARPPDRPAIQPNLVHPYPLQANFTGRVNERRELSAWLADDTHPICALVAIGGMGKSALAWYWIKNDVITPDSAFTGDGVMWWSFYEGESSFAKFIDEALKYVSDQPIDTGRFPTSYDRTQELRRLLQTKRVLFILDGFERQLRAYASLDAAYQLDDTALLRDQRACVDPLAERWLTDLAAGTTRAKLLITSRLMVSNLEDRAGDALAGVLERELRELPREDAVQFMRAQGVTKGTDSEIASACAAYGYHPLSLRLLSGLIARDQWQPGDIAAAPRHDVSDDLVQRQHFVLEQSYNSLPEMERMLLSRLAAFRSPMSYDALLIFNDFGNEARFEDALNDLRLRGLVRRDIATNRYDLHPIVRHYAYERLTDKTGVHNRLREYFEKIPAPNADKVQSIEELLPIIELYHHTVRAGQYDDAARMFYDRINQSLYYRLGAYQIQIELLLALFPEGEESLPRLQSTSAQTWVLATLATSYSLSGQTRKALRAFQLGNEIAEKVSSKHNLAIGLQTTAATAQVALGLLADAEHSLLRSIELFRQLDDELNEAAGYLELGRLRAYLGAFQDSAQAMQLGLGVFEKHKESQGVCMTWAYHALCALLKGNAQEALKAARQSRALADVQRYERDTIRAEWLLGAALVMEGTDLNLAATNLSEALTRCRRINLVEMEPYILQAWARWHRTRGDEQAAQAYAQEALALADRCEYRLAQAEIHNLLSLFALDEGNREVARRHADAARERAWCDGPPYYYKPALDEAERILRELSAEE